MKESWEEFVKRMKKLNWNWSPFMGSGNPRPEVIEWMQNNQHEDEVNTNVVG